MKKFNEQRIKWLWILTPIYVLVIFVLIFHYKLDTNLREYASIMDLIIKRNVVKEGNYKDFMDLFSDPTWKEKLGLEAIRVGCAFSFGLLLAISFDYLVISKLSWMLWRSRKWKTKNN